MTILAIKTAHKLGVDLTLIRDGMIEAHPFPDVESDALLIAIDRVVRVEELAGLIVLEGPGSFTAVRTAVVVANAIAFARKIPVVGAVSLEDGLQKLSLGANGFPLAPQYDREPNITMSQHS